MRDYSFGNFLHKLRERRGLSQYQLGMLVGVSDKAVSKWENGSAKPRSQILYKLSDILGVTVDELLACKYLSAESGNEKGVFAMKNKLWQEAQRALRARYGKTLYVEILNRYLSEYAEFRETDIIVYFDLLRRIKSAADELGEHILERGGVGASFAAFVLGATEINPLKPHYFCPNCHKVEFNDTVLTGWDLPEKRCSCGRAFIRDGQNLPFEALRPFIHKKLNVNISVSHGFYRTAEKIIGEYFGKDTALCSGFEAFSVIDGKISSLTGGRALSQEEYRDILSQHTTVTLMIDDNLDFLRSLEKKTGTSSKDADFLSPQVTDAFQKGDTEGIPQFGTDFVRNMIKEVNPTCVHHLIQIAGLSHGTGVWTDNAQTLIKDGRSVSDVISYRDDVFNYINDKMKNISNTGFAYKVMEDTRRGIYAKGGVSNEAKRLFTQLGIEDWFINSIEKINYLFPKAHGVRYVKYALIFMWYKLKYPDVFMKLLDK